MNINSKKYMIPMERHVLTRNMAKFHTPTGGATPSTRKQTAAMGSPLNATKNTNSPTRFANKVKNNEIGRRSSIPILPVRIQLDSSWLIPPLNCEDSILDSMT